MWTAWPQLFPQVRDADAILGVPISVLIWRPVVDSPSLIDNALRKELIDYYKWVASLAVFILSTSLALANFLGAPPHKLLLASGWVLLATSIAGNWLLVKSLISAGTISATPLDEWTAKHLAFADGWVTRVKVFGFMQQASFMLGSAFVAVAFALRMFGT